MILAGLLLFTGGFFAAHSIGSGWTGASRPRRPGAGGVALRPRVLRGLQRHRLGRRLAVPVLGLDSARPRGNGAGLHDGGAHRHRASRTAGRRQRALPGTGGGAPGGLEGLEKIGDNVRRVLRPAETRSRPACGLASAATGRWVRPAGCWIRVSMPPSETAWVISVDGCRKRGSACSALRQLEGQQRAPGLPSGCPTRAARGSHSGRPG